MTGHIGRYLGARDCRVGEFMGGRVEALECCCGRLGHRDGSDGVNDGPTVVVGNGFVGQKHGAD